MYISPTRERVLFSTALRCMNAYCLSVCPPNVIYNAKGLLAVARTAEFLVFLMLNSIRSGKLNWTSTYLV